MQPLTLALLQTATQWHDAEANRKHFEQLFSEVPHGTDVVVLPEMFSTGFTKASREVSEPMDGPTVAWLRAQASASGRVLCGSLVIEENGAFYNRFLWLRPDGTASTYDKKHRFRMAGEHEHYAAGTAQGLIEHGGWKIRPLVCYDLRFPVWLRNTDRYDVLLCVANWPAPRRAAWNTLLRARAIENQCYMAAVNIIGTDGNDVPYSGGSAAYGPDGAVLAERFDDAGVVSVTLDPKALQQQREAFPVWQDADSFELK